MFTFNTMNNVLKIGERNVMATKMSQEMGIEIISEDTEGTMDVQ